MVMAPSCLGCREDCSNSLSLPEFEVSWVLSIVAAFEEYTAAVAIFAMSELLDGVRIGLNSRF